MKTLTLSLTVLLGLLILSSKSMALVDYTSSDDSAPPAKEPRRIKINKRPTNSLQTTNASASSAGGSSVGNFSIGTSFNSSNVEVGDRAGKVNGWQIDGHFQTNYGVYLDVNHYMASSDSDDLTQEVGMQHGNPKAKIGFNWLRFGNGADAGTIDIIAGLSFAQDDSSFASSRTDKIFGLETSKKMLSFVLGLGYEYRITGNPGTENELTIGNIQKLYAVLGWMATPDIRFTFEGGTYKITSGNGNYALDEDTSFGYVSPALSLGLSPTVSLDFGAVFRTKRLGVGSLVDARLYDLKGAYGSSLFAGLAVNL